MKLVNIILTPDLLLEFSEKVINQLIDKFTKDKGPNPTIIRAYIQRFKEIQSKVDQPDPFRYSWKEFERVVDANRTSRVKTGKFNPQADDANKIYDKDGVRVFRGESQKACIKYGQGYSWCISARSDDNMYSYYRQGSNFPYFVFNDNITSDKDEDGKFIDPAHALVIFVDKSPGDDEFSFQVTDAENDGDQEIGSIRNLQTWYPWINSDIVKLLVPVPSSNKEKLESEIKEKYSRSLFAFHRNVNDRYKDIHKEVIGSISSAYDKVKDYEKFLDLVKEGKFIMCKGTGKQYFGIPVNASQEEIERQTSIPLRTHTIVTYTLTGDVDKAVADNKKVFARNNLIDHTTIVKDYTSEVIYPLKDKKLLNAIKYIVLGMQVLRNQKNKALNKLKMGIE